MSDAARTFDDADQLAEAIVSSVGREIVLGLPLGLGKANRVANALFRRAAANPSIKLRIFTALTLERPQPPAELARRFIGPVLDRLIGGYPELEYAKALREDRLPANVEVHEFFFMAGAWTGVPYAQQHYVSTNYSHAIATLLDYEVNVIAQLVAKQADRYSLSCNPDMTLDLLEARDAGRSNLLLVGEVHPELPFMPGDADLPESRFAFLLEDPSTDYPLFAPPKQPIGTADYATGLHVARLVPDGGSLQIGIGSIGDAVVQGLLLRHRENTAFRDTITRLAGTPLGPKLHEQPFEQGLYGVSEMLVDSFLELIDAGILKREVDGAVLHAAFFLGPKAFYRRLREMSPEQRARIRMTSVQFTNELFGDEQGKREARVHARFVNNAMMVTLMGAVVSDGLANGSVISGVGGQYNFTAQAFALQGAHSVITLNATRMAGGGPTSNILWNYGHTTIPRHLRDVVVTEYGIAFLRGRSDRDTIAALLNITDSRFQQGLLDRAKRAGKIERDYVIPPQHRDNTPERIALALTPARESGLLPLFPFGSDFTATEQRLIPAMKKLKAASASKRMLLGLAWRGLRAGAPTEAQRECLERLDLAKPRSAKDRLYQLLVTGALD